MNMEILWRHNVIYSSEKWLSDSRGFPIKDAEQLAYQALRPCSIRIVDLVDIPPNAVCTLLPKRNLAIT
jgi:hypothetical protein